MRTGLLLASALLMGSLLAGCSNKADDGDDPDDPVLRAPYVLDCTISNWDEPCLVWASPNESDSKTEVDIAVNPLDPKNVVVGSKDRDRLASDCVWAVPSYTKDGGYSWNTTYIGGQMADRAPTDLLYGWQCITDPIMTFNKDGVLFYTLQTYKYDPLGLPEAPVGPVAIPPEMGIQVLAVSRDGGATFPQLIPLHAGDEFAVFHDYMHTGTNPQTGTVFTIWNQLTALAASTPVVVAYHPGQVAAEAPRYLISPESPLGLGESGIVGMKDGTVVAWLGGFNSPDAAYYAVSVDDGATWSSVEHAFDFMPMGNLANASYRYGTVVELATDNSDSPYSGCLYATWGGIEQGVIGTSDIYVRVSCDKAQTWSEPILVNKKRDDGQWMPRIAVDGHGGVHIVYYTRAYDPDRSLIDAEWAYSIDGGMNWTTQRLTTKSFDGNLGIHQDGFPFIGDYIGISAAGDHIYMGFPTTFTGKAEVAVAHVVADPEVLASVMPGHAHA